MVLTKVWVIGQPWDNDWPEQPGINNAIDRATGAVRQALSKLDATGRVVFSFDNEPIDHRTKLKDARRSVFADDPKDEELIRTVISQHLKDY